MTGWFQTYVLQDGSSLAVLWVDLVSDGSGTGFDGVKKGVELGLS